MSTYRRYTDGRTERWNPREGKWLPCEPDEPETRQRKPNEGMYVLPAEKLLGDKPVMSIEDMIQMLTPLS